jgi:hypothetical protein
MTVIARASPVVRRGVRKIMMAAVGLVLAAAFAWQHSTGQAARASEGRLAEPLSVATGVSAAGLNDDSSGVRGRPAVSDGPASPKRQRLPLRETPSLAVPEREPVGVAMPGVVRATRPLRPSIAAAAEPRGLSARMPTRPEVASIELPHAAVVSAPSPVPAGTLAATPSFVSAGSDPKTGAAADADALRALVEIFAAAKPHVDLDSRASPR